MTSGRQRRAQRKESRSAKRDGKVIGNCLVTGKRSYPNEREARRRVRASKKVSKFATQNNAYDCPHCPHWHTTTQQPTRGQS